MPAIERIQGFACEVDQEKWEELVRVADEVGLKADESSRREGVEGGQYPIASIDDGALMTYSHAEASETLIPYPDFLAKLKGEEKWEPKNGEEVEVSGNGRDWYVRIFVVYHLGTYHCEMESDNSLLSTWKFCRPLRPTITRTEAEALLNKRIID